MDVNNQIFDMVWTDVQNQMAPERVSDGYLDIYDTYIKEKQ